MNSVTTANLENIEGIVKLDCEIIGNMSRRKHIEKIVGEGRCLIIKEEDEVQAFLLFDTNFLNVVLYR